MKITKENEQSIKEFFEELYGKDEIFIECNFINDNSNSILNLLCPSIDVASNFCFDFENILTISKKFNTEKISFCGPCIKKDVYYRQSMLIFQESKSEKDENHE